MDVILTFSYTGVIILSSHLFPSPCPSPLPISHHSPVPSISSFKNLQFFLQAFLIPNQSSSFKK